jgi:transposase
MIPAAVVAALGDEGVAWLTAVLAQRDDALSEAHQRITALEEENRKLLALVRRDSSNSSKPPSSDPPGGNAVRRREGRRKPSGRKAGGQPGHVGGTRVLRPVEQADRIVPHYPTTCGGCGADLAGASERSQPLPHQQYELPPLKLELVHHWLHRLLCPRCGTETTAEFGAADRTGQGPRLTAFIALLGVHYRQSRALVRDLVDDLFDLRLSTGTVQSCWERTAAALDGPMEPSDQFRPK